MTTYQTPGVYYQRFDAGEGAIAAIRSDVPGFVGIAERGPVDTPVPVQSWRQFQAHFGDFSGNAFLAYAVRGFFENGGRRCWVVRVACRDPAGGVRHASLSISTPGGVPVWRLRAVTSGSWGNAIGLTLSPRRAAEVVIAAGQADAKGAGVSSVSGFSRGSLVRLSQGGVEAWRVLSEVDAVRQRLTWVSDDSQWALPYQAALSGFDSDREIQLETQDYTLALTYRGRPMAVYEGLSLIPESDRYGPQVLREPQYPTEVSTDGTFPAAPPLLVIEELRPPFDERLHPAYRHQLFQTDPLQQWVPLSVTPGAALTLEGGEDALSRLRVEDFAGSPWQAGDDAANQAAGARGFRALDQVAEVATLALPDLHIQPRPVAVRAPLPPCEPDPCLSPVAPPTAAPVGAAAIDAPPIFDTQGIYRIQADLVAHCEARRDRIAVLDPPYETARDQNLGIAPIRAWRQRFDSKYAALYHPWLSVIDPLRGVAEPTREIPPSGHVLGQYAAAERESGVHKAPANRPLAWCQDLTLMLDDERHGMLNQEGINLIRGMPGRGIRIQGARTLSSDSDWRYVNVRRLMLMIKKAVELSVQWAAFEPNDHDTRNKLRLTLMSFLIALWQQGALAGDSVEQSLFVKCDEENNPPDERNLGHLWVDIGVAPAKPFEFIVLRVGRSGNAFEIAAENTLKGGG
ncbi:MAG: phage tail sheath subtilisin-like domain-containing protein [Candidatus Thiodiazotropha sp.]